MISYLKYRRRTVPGMYRGDQHDTCYWMEQCIEELPERIAEHFLNYMMRYLNRRFSKYVPELHFDWCKATLDERIAYYESHKKYRTRCSGALKIYFEIVRSLSIHYEQAKSTAAYFMPLANYDICDLEFPGHAALAYSANHWHRHETGPSPYDDLWGVFYWKHQAFTDRLRDDFQDQVATWFDLLIMWNSHEVHREANAENHPFWGTRVDDIAKQRDWSW